jgi:hypothetical protein
MARLRNYSDKHHDTRKLYGAIAGAIISGNAKDYALKQGLYIIEQSGDTVKNNRAGPKGKGFVIAMRNS